MKNAIRTLGFAAIAAIALSFALTALSLTGCDSGDSGTTTVPVSGVTLNKSTLSLTVGGSETLSATVAPDNATNKAVTWSTSDPAKVTVVNGTVTAVAAGTATITVTTKDGNKTDTCAVTVTDSAASNGWGEWEITAHATCTTEGKRIRTSIDGSATQEEVIPVNPDAHDWKQISGTPATCEADGNGTRKCDRCGKEESGVLPKLGHLFENWRVTKEPTCSAEGVETSTCEHDGTTATTRAVPIDPTAHDWEQLAGTPPTCTTDGSGSRKCNICGIVETLNVIPALGHDYQNWTQTTAPTCTTAGVETGTCTRDGTTTTTRTIPINPTAHDYKWQATTPASYTAAGIETEICSHDPTHTRATRPISQIPFTTVTALGTWLSSQPANAAAAAYTVKLNVSNLSTPTSIQTTLTNNATKYVSLDLSGSTFTSIGNYAFSGCTSLTSITIPDSVTRIMVSAFYNCTGLTSVIIPASVTTIESGAFMSCTKLTSITIPNGVTGIENSTFSDCTSLTSVTIPNSITFIGNTAFRNCTSLTSVTIGNSVTSIGENAFASCTSLTSITIPNSVTTIRENAFSGCTSLTNVTIGNGVTNLNGAFMGCTGLTQIEMPASITGIDAGVIRDWTSLRKIIFTGTGSFSSIDDGTVVIKDNTELVYILNATGNIVVPEGITAIGVNAFFQRVNVTRIELPTTLTTIDNQPFYGCTGLTVITLPQNVTTIGRNAFGGCTNLTLITSLATTPPALEEDMMGGMGSLFGWQTPEGLQIKVPAASVAAYKAADGWSNYADKISAIE